MNLTFRRAVIEDVAAVTDIYNQAILDGNCTCDTETFSIAERTHWVEAHLNDHYPLYIATVDEKTVGYGYLSEYRFGRPAVAGTAEVSYYLDFHWHGKGIGSKLLEFLMEEARSIGFENLVAILMGSNIPSISLLKKYGFELRGSIPNAVHIGNLITDHVYYGLSLQKEDALI